MSGFVPHPNLRFGRLVAMRRKPTDKANAGLEEIRKKMLAFRGGFDSLQLATVSDAGIPEASAAPMVAGRDDAFYIFISALARHTANLAANARAGVLFIEPVEAAANPFVRQRLSYRCRAEFVPRESQAFAEILQRFEQQFGEIVGVLVGLPDFQLFRLVPVGGTYVRGFGQAWNLNGPGLRDLEPVNPVRGRDGEDAEKGSGT